MKVRWWRIGAVFERDGDPYTWTLHVRAFTEKKARALVEERLPGTRHAIYRCHASEPLARADAEERIVADYGPYRRSWEDETIADLRGLL